MRAPKLPAVGCGIKGVRVRAARSRAAVVAGFAVPSPTPYPVAPMNPALLFLLLFVTIPLVELYLLIEVGAGIGAVPTIGLTLATALLGGVLVRLQGFSTALRVRQGLERGEVPAVEMLEGLVLLISGILLLLPGFVTDAVGFLFLVPPVRRAALVASLRRMRVVTTTQAGPGGRGEGVIEGEWRRETEEGERIEHDDRGPPTG